MDAKFQIKRLDVEFTFFDGSQKLLRGLQVQATIKCDTMTSFLSADIYGLSTDTIDSLVGFNQSVFTEANSKKITLYAVDGPSRIQIFSGNINQAVADFNALPNVPLSIIAQSDMDNRLTVIDPVSFDGAKSIKEILKGILDNFNKTVEDKNKKLVLGRCESNATLTDVSLNGGLFDMIQNVCDQADCRFSFEENRLIVIKNTGASADSGLVIAYNTNMIGFPMLTAQGCVVKSYFNPYYRTNELVTVKSIQVKFQKHQDDATLQQTAFTEKEQKFTVVGITHKLFTEVQDGEWETELELIYATMIGGVTG